MKKCPLFEICGNFRKEAEEIFTEKGIWIADRTTCYCPSWLLDNKKQCKNYHPELILQSTKNKEKKNEKTIRKTS